jgi:hypothetical protein
MLEEAVEEELVPLLAEHLADGLTLSLLVRRVAGDEVLHVHPTAEAEAPEHDGLAFPVYQPGSSDGQVRAAVRHVSLPLSTSGLRRR